MSEKTNFTKESSVTIKENKALTAEKDPIQRFEEKIKAIPVGEDGKALNPKDQANLEKLQRIVGKLEERNSGLTTESLNKGLAQEAVEARLLKQVDKGERLLPSHPQT
jgi:hypothetical protein